MTTTVRYGCWSILALAAAVALGACGSVRYPAHYVLEVAPPPLAAAPPPSVLGPLVVRELACSPYLCEGRVVYREEPHRVGFYDYHRWALNPRSALTRVLADRIRASSLFESVTVAGSPARAAYLLRGEIERFEEVDEKTSVTAICTISAEIVDVKTGRAIWRGTDSDTVPVQQRDVPAVVIGLGVASRTVTDRLVASIATQLAANRSP
ncbi:MAG TPA: ABC-type transport auxiliary lipoprotein family protein [Vicinamibacterales bacterium]|nr:ABC-type transport auxiliary lipoprotein family protein [Vicinamibacterales bacterium]